MKTFLDVGAHVGETLQAVMADRSFERIVCFEPASQCWPALRALADRRVSIEQFGLWDRACSAGLFQPGTKGAGLWKKDNGRSDDVETCKFVRATEWMRAHIAEDDVVYLKLNCEGAECDILDDLLDSGEFDSIAYTMVDFDVRKIASQKHRQAELVERLAVYPAPRVLTSKQAMRGDTHAARIHNWLALCR